MYRNSVFELTEANEMSNYSPDKTICKLLMQTQLKYFRNYHYMLYSKTVQNFEIWNFFLVHETLN